jgi:hypothetical protein
MRLSIIQLYEEELPSPLPYFRIPSSHHRPIRPVFLLFSLLEAPHAGSRPHLPIASHHPEGVTYGRHERRISGVIFLSATIDGRAERVIRTRVGPTSSACGNKSRRSATLVVCSMNAS